MLPLLGTRDRASGAARLACGAALAVASLGAACSQGDPRWPELTDWERAEVWAHDDVVGFDRVAVATGPNYVAWLTRAAGAAEELAYWELRDGETVDDTELAMPDAPVVIPLAVASDYDGWVSVAATRDSPRGDNTGLVAWQRGGPRPRPERLEAPERGAAVPSAVNTGRAGDTALVAGVADGQVVTWTSHDGDDWRSDTPDLGVEAEMATIDVLGDGDRVVLAGVDVQGRAHLWTSIDGETWLTPEVDDLPTGVGSVTLLGQLDDGELAVAWLGQGQDETSPRRARAATIQRFAGEDLTDEGAIGARDDDGIPRFSLEGATLSPEGRLAIVGSAGGGGDTVAPMLWVRDGDRWEPSDQPELTRLLDRELRAVTTVGDVMVGVVTPAPRHIDVELWRWTG